MKSCYQLIKTMTKFEIETSHWLFFFLKKKKPVNMSKWETTVQLQAGLVHCPISAQVGLVITNHVREFCYSFD